MMPSVPTQEEFNQASAKMAYRDRNWVEISATARAKLADVFDLHEFAIFPNGCEFAAILFLRTDEDVKRATESGGETKAREVLLNVIRPFRQECAEIKILVELDSHENVIANYEGNYFNRLR